MTSRIKEMASKILADRPEVDMEAGRRSFMKSLTAGAATAAVAGVAGIAATPASAAASLDVTILTFALNLEYLEAEFYNYAFNGHGLPASLIGDQAGRTIVKGGSTVVPFTHGSVVQAYSQELATDETNHVAFLRSALVGAGVVPASRPNIDLLNSFNGAAQAAGLGASFDPFASEANFVLGSYIFEDVGVTAYHGAATLITNKAYLDAAAGILATEAYHAGLIRTYLFANGFSSQTQAISFLRTRLSGDAGTPRQNNDHGVGTTANPGITNGDGNSIQADRTINQVLDIVYADLTLSQKPGGFFPNGVNMPT